MIYLMLDKDDITNVCGKISTKELIKELNLTHSQLSTFIILNKIFRNRYILVEDTKKSCKRVKDKLIMQSNSGKKYYASCNGEFYVIYKSGNKKYVSGYIKKRGNRSMLCFKMAGKEVVAKNAIAKAFIKDYTDQEIVILKDERDIRNVSVDNIEIVKKRRYSKMTGAMSKSKQIAMYENGKLIRTFPSARKAEGYLFISRQAICDICNKKTKKPIYDLRWI